MTPGQKVTYIPYPDCPTSIYEHGKVKSVADNGDLFVVYKCDGQWHRFEEFTAAKTRREDLVEDWI